MSIVLVVAIAENGVIGRGGGLPWRLSSDLKRFKAITMGRPIVMGRKTWDSLGRPLPGRTNIVVSRNAGLLAEGALVASSLEEAVALGLREAGAGHIYVIGGAEIYRLALGLADTLHVTHIGAGVEGDAFFPEIDPALWEVRHCEHVPAGERDEFPTRYVIYGRRGQTG